MRARSGASATPRGGGMRRTTASSSSGTLLPSLAEMRRISSGFVPMSSCSSCARRSGSRSEEHTSELQSRLHLVCRLLLEKKKTDACKNRSLHTAHVLRPVPWQHDEPYTMY